ncbi:hypothetical protein FOA52_008737 [Chlamydomonas sp. UWO 241]|nr:hypothetical protein FOA52_008737 [Chlamydomonas sp. UWO 241]
MSLGERMPASDYTEAVQSRTAWTEEESAPEHMASDVSERGRSAKAQPTVLLTTVDIGGGRSDQLIVRRGDDPSEVARAFCVRHSLPEAVLGPLTEHLLENLRKASKSLLLKAGSQGPSPLSKPPGATDATAPATPEPEPFVSSGTAAAAAAALAPESAVDVTPPLQQSAMPEGLSSASSQQAPLSFANPADEQRLVQQLSAKLVPVRASMLTMSTEDPKGSASRVHSARMSGGPLHNGRRGSRSCDPSPRDSVHLRLYNKAVDAKKKTQVQAEMAEIEKTAAAAAERTRMSWISSEMMRGRVAGPFDNYGEMLYAEGQEAAALRRSKVEVLKSERDAAELHGATFQPQITALAKALCGGGDPSEGSQVWSRLSNAKRTHTLERIKEIKEMQEAAEVRECTFKPRIDAKSRAMMSERAELLRALKMSPHDQLFQDAVRRQQKLEELSGWVPEEATFQPAVNKSSAALEWQMRASLSESLAGMMGAAGATGDAPPVVARLYQAGERTKAKLDAARAKYDGDFDPATGKLLYQPEVGRAPRGGKARVGGASDDGSIHATLYREAMEQHARRQALAEAEGARRMEEAKLGSATSAASKKLVNKLKLTRFGQVFDYLDVEQAGSVDLLALVREPAGRVDDLDTEVREDVELAAATYAKALGVDLQATSGAEAAPAPRVNQEHFASLMEQALATRRGPRAYLVPSPSGKVHEVHSFRPSINARSREIAARLRPADTDTHALLHAHAEAARVRYEADRRAADKAELAECTFHPSLNLNSLAAEGRALRRAWAAGQSEEGTPRSGSHTPGGQHHHHPHSHLDLSATLVSAAAAAAAQPTRRGGQGGGGATDLDQFLALEAEVQSALAGVRVADAQLGAAAAAGDAPQAQQAQQQQRRQQNPRQVWAAQQQQAQRLAGAGAPAGGGADLAATEALLLQLLGNCADPGEVLGASFQAKLEAALGVVGSAPPPLHAHGQQERGPAASGKTRGSVTIGKAAPTAGDAPQAVSMYVVPAGMVERLAHDLDA